ncbi:peritrophin-48-like [Portunus trituberculatus]|uniref:peritrophin-48-like n=1 Tax=Portunus trituberculatus TaxID=210409 RepID=UPI001E1CE827|nr:peritrophin-48-like [Portunus trituberculatus]
MAPRVGCLLLPILFIASARVILVDAHKCGDPPEGDPCTADPAITCAGCGEGATVSDPFDCTSFYVCDGEGDYLYLDPLPCPDGYIFDEIERGCIIGGRCSFNCGKPGKGGNCLYSCEANYGRKISDPFDCSVYHQCTGTEPGPAITCPADAPYFNGEKCDVDESLCCHCRPYCYADDAGKYVEDPTDCRKYFECVRNHEIPKYGGECKDGEHFDLHAKQCSSTAPCMTLCRNVVDGDGCIDSYTCQEIGYFPKCKTQCLREYYHCVEVSDDYATPERCPNNLVFNPDTLTCIKNETCPYNYK